MNLPNKLTRARVFLIPFFLLFMYWRIPFHFFIALAVFAAASITDALDGKIARSRNLVTNFGKFLDPLADKVLVLAALTVFVEMDDVRMGAIPLIIITAREFMVSGLRLLAADSGVVVAAGQAEDRIHYGDYHRRARVAELLQRLRVQCPAGGARRRGQYHSARAHLDIHSADCDIRRDIPQGLRAPHRHG